MSRSPLGKDNIPALGSTILKTEALVYSYVGAITTITEFVLLYIFFQIENGNYFHSLKSVDNLIAKQHN